MKYKCCVLGQYQILKKAYQDGRILNGYGLVGNAGYLIQDILCPIRWKSFKRHINPLMFDVIYDKPEGVARGVYHV